MVFCIFPFVRSRIACPTLSAGEHPVIAALFRVGSSLVGRLHTDTYPCVMQGAVAGHSSDALVAAAMQEIDQPHSI